VRDLARQLAALITAQKAEESRAAKLGEPAPRTRIP